MRKDTTTATLLVFIQFLALAVLALTCQVIILDLPYGLLEAAGILLAAWTLWHNVPGNFHIAPKLKSGGKLIREGPYRYIRHPMYSSVMLVTLAWVLNAGSSLTSWLVWSLLTIILLLKLRREERLLAKAHPEYTSYMKRTRRLIPFIF